MIYVAPTSDLAALVFLFVGWCAGFASRQIVRGAAGHAVGRRIVTACRRAVLMPLVLRSATCLGPRATSDGEAD